LKRKEKNMAKAEIFAGICGFNTTVETVMEGSYCDILIESDCKSIQKLAESLKRVNPFEEISFRGKGPTTLRMAAKDCAHTACPVPAGIIKAIEIAAGLALPADATIKLSKS
jgi:hypothetical protein